MSQQELNTGVIYTKSNCIGCNKCISGCGAFGANVIMQEKDLDKYSVAVDPNKCILCGHCIDACLHNARTFRDDTDDFFDALSNGENISILIAPSLLTDYEKQYNNILGYLKHLGVKHIYNTSFGAEIMVWAYINLIQNFGLKGVISQFCPVIVNYLEKYKPELLEFLMPIQSPMMCTAIYAKDYLKRSDKLAYISPCIASKYEIDDVNTYGDVSYNVTFDRLLKKIKEIDISSFHAEDEVPYGLGSLIPVAGGLSDNMKLYIGFNEVLIQTTGQGNIFPYFDHYHKEVTSNGDLPFLVDVLSCTDGCNFGTGTNCGVEYKNEIAFSAHRAKENAYNSGNVPTGNNHSERLEKLNKRFEDYALSSFVRQYGRTLKVLTPPLSQDETDEIYLSMYKNTPTLQHTDCGACGYKTCKQMVNAIGNHFNYKENCINYSKDRIRLETEKTSHLLNEISIINEELKCSTQLKSNFLANMSHEIRTPMNAVIGMAEMALRGELPEEERNYIQQIKSSGRSLLAIINDILDFSKIESGKMEINKTEYAVSSLINDTINLVRARIGEKDIELLIDVDPNIPQILLGDDIRIKQILVNFAGNAVKFTEEGCVEICLNQEENPDGGIFLVGSIRDTGIGIKKEDLEKLFTSFQQVDSKRNRNIEGTGLGLTISREFVRLMDGDVFVKSIYGQGSTFSFRIPQQVIDALPSATIKNENTAHTASYFINPYLRDGFIKSISKFNVVDVNCSSIEEIKKAVINGAKFIFIEAMLFNLELREYAKTLTDITLSVIVDPMKDIVSDISTRKLTKPIYSFNVASFLNSESEKSVHNQTHEEYSLFEAPNANILIVDDNAINLTVAKGLLSPLHMNIICALSAKEAINLIKTNSFDIILMDHMMPDIDGIEATQMIRAIDGEFYKNLPIIALTANAINNAREMFLNAGMNDFVAKPIEMIDITSKLRRWLPPDKVKTLRHATAELNDNLKVSTIEDFPKIAGLDVEAGLSISGNLNFYEKILGDYYEVIETKADLIEKYANEGNIKGYTIEVHALKSASKIIGATKLSELAAKLEKCGNAQDIGTIDMETEKLLQLYRSYIPTLAPYQKVKSIGGTVEIEKETLNEKLSKLYEALNNFDIDLASEIVEELLTFIFDESSTEILNKLHSSIKSMEYDDAIEYVIEWQNS